MIRAVIPATILVALASCGPTENPTVSMGSPVNTGPEAVIKEDAARRVAGKLNVAKIDVVEERERRTTGDNIIVGYSAWISVYGCTGNHVIYYDQTAAFDQEHSTLKC